MSDKAESRKLFLDDVRPCPLGWDCVRSFDAFCAYIREFGVPDVISFDHDLADEHYPWNWNPENDLGKQMDYSKFREKTGYDCAKWLIENGYKLKQWRVHSMNPVGAENIRKFLERNA